MLTINATGDTTLHTAGKYCPEDILVKVPAGGSGGGSVETCTVKAIKVNSATDTNGERLCSFATFTAFDNDTFQAKTIDNTVDGITFENVVCGSSFCMECYNGDLITENCSLVTQMSSAFKSSICILQINGDGFIKQLATKPCFVRDTRISLSNGTTKLVQDITYDDELLVWDFDNTRYSSAKPLWIKKVQTASYYYRCEFDNGIILNLVGSDGKCHRVFDVDNNLFEYATDCVGNTIAVQNGVSRLISCERVYELVEFYNIITEYHLNLFANSVLTSCRLNNLYPIENMQFVKDNRPNIPKEEYAGVDDSFYYGLRLGERDPEYVGSINEYIKHLQSIMA